MQDALRIVEKAGEAIALSTRRIFNNKGAKGSGSRSMLSDKLKSIECRPEVRMSLDIMV